jgi:outer membrane protein assembly factor BamB
MLLMKLRRAIRQVILGLLFVAIPGPQRAQEPEAVRKIALPSLDTQVRAELAALDGRLNPVPTPHLAATLIGQLAPGAPAVAAFGPILADPRTNEIWEQLAEAYYRMALDSGDALVALPEDMNRGPAWSSGQVRRLCQQRFTVLPRTALHWYRQRVDAEARALFEQGRRTRSPGLLRRVVEELFCSSVGDQALDLLGDLAFERGEFDEARHWWSQLAPLDPARADQLRFPDPQVDLIRVQAKQILALMFQGRLSEAQSRLVRFQRQYPHAEGDLAAETGRYSDILRKTLTAFTLNPSSGNDEPWTTFGGDPLRNRVLPQDLSWHLWEDGPTWRVPLPPLAFGTSSDSPRLNPARRTAFHPIIVHGQVLLADHRSVVSYHLATGKELFRFDLRAAGLSDPGPGFDAKVLLRRFTLSADHDRAYVRLGALGVPSPKEDIAPARPGVQRIKNRAKAEASYLVCLDLTQPETKKPRLLWHVTAPAEDKARIWFEGSPLVHDGRVFAALSKRAGGRIVTSIVCYDTLGRQRWAREVCDCPEREDAALAPRDPLHLLTWTGGQIVYCSHAGAIVAVDAWTGQPTWGVRYAPNDSAAMRLAPPARDLAPCVCADGCVYAAPSDTNSVFCIDGQTGQVRWTLDDIDVVHVLGLAQGKLVLATRHGVQAVDGATGEIDWLQPSDGRLPSLGRGLLAGGWLFWPTVDDQLPYRALTLPAGQQPLDPTRLSTLPAGNWAFGHGCLAIAGVDELVVYVPPSPSKPPLLVPRPQARVESLYRTARAHAVSGQTSKAAGAYLDLLDVVAAQPDAGPWRTLIEGRLAMLAMTDPGPPSWFAAFTDPRLPPGVRLTALKRQAEGATPTDAAAICRRVLRDPALRTAWLPGETPEQGVAWASRQQTTCQGDPGDAVALYHFARCHGASAALGNSLLKLAEQALAAQRWGKAADIYRRSLALPLPEHQRARAERGLARAYEKQASEPAPASIDGPALPLVRAWSQDDGRIWAGDRGDDFFFCTQPGQVTCRSADGTLRWRQPLVFVPAWIERWRDLVVFAGPDFVQALRVHDGQEAWSLPAPSRLVPVGKVQRGKPTLSVIAQGFVHCERWDDTLLLLDDHRHFFRLRLDTGEIAWRHASIDATVRPLNSGAFSRHVMRIGAELLVQTNGGQATWLDGAPLGAPSRAWLESPHLVGDRIVAPGEAGRIHGYRKVPPHSPSWTYQIPFTTSLTGELPRLFSTDPVLLALVPRNDGSEWHRLDPATGKFLWSVPANRLPDQVDVGSACIGDLSFYHVDAGRLCARSLNDGALQWERPLPTGHACWQLRYTKHYLTVAPNDEPRATDFFVGFLDPFDGRWLQRLSFPGGRGPGQVLLTPRQVLVSIDGKVHGFRPLDLE